MDNTVFPSQGVMNQAQPGMTLGLDTSHYDKPLNWVKAKAAGVGWMYTKATDGVTSLDSTLLKHLEAAQNAGLPCGAYHFFRASHDGLAQAQRYLAATAGLPLAFHVLDWEVSDGESADRQAIEAQAWLDAVEQKTGKVPWIYGGESFLHDLKLGLEFARYPLIVAHYTDSLAKVSCPKPWAKPTAWQFSESFKIDGVWPGDTVDANWLLVPLSQLIGA
jgi:lysozyme